MKSIFLTFLTLISILAISCKSDTVKAQAKSDEPKQRDSMVTAEPFKLSLAQWSFHNALFDGKMDNLEFAGKAGSMGFEGIEYVNAFFKDKAEDMAYLGQMKQAALEAGVESLLIMVDGEGDLGELDTSKRKEAVENHKKWVDAALYLGCHSIRVNAYGVGTAEEVSQAAIEGLRAISTYAATQNINVIVENHGSYSSDGEWLSNVIKSVGLKNCGTLPDFGNFCIERKDGERWGASCVKEYDKYKGVKEMMPYAKGVSAKSNNFNDSGEEVDINYKRMIEIVRASGYKGFIGVEYEGKELSEEKGIAATKVLLERYNK